MKYKSFLKFLSLTVIATGISVFLLRLYSDSLDSQIKQRYNPALGRSYGVDEMNKGISILKNNAQKGDLIILGSSELDTQEIPQNPRNFFPNSQLNCDVDLVGRAVVQNLQNAIKVGALGEYLKNQKLVVIVSAQWFIGNQVEQRGFNSHFSPIQFNEFLNSKNTSEDSKKYVCSRASELLNHESSLASCALKARLYDKNDLFSTLVNTLLKPFYFVEDRFLPIKEKHQALKAVKLFENEPKRDVLNLDWDKEEAIAQKMGEEACTNNDIFVQDSYYSTYLEPQWDYLKNSSIDVDLTASKEFKDYEYFLKICKENDVKPYIVFMPTNGWYYDYIGITKDKRIMYYDKLLSLANSFGFDCLDLRDKEYEPYTLKDVMHFGWKGWLYVDRKITEYFS